tara:strand:+ start:251 stop:493 length:243 start_codon:yes stop_codon:yes gene_type:complete
MLIKQKGQKMKKVVYNIKPDPIVRVREYVYDSNSGKPELVKDTVYDPNKPQPGKQYRLIGKASEKSIARGNSWQESEVKQ